MSYMNVKRKRADLVKNKLNGFKSKLVEKSCCQIRCGLNN